MKRKKAAGSVVRDIALALPEAEEVDHMGSPSFRVSGKIFAQLALDGSVALVKVSLVEQEELVRAHPDRFSVPMHWAKFGWTYVRVVGTTANELRNLLERSYCLIAPRTLASSVRKTKWPP